MYARCRTVGLVFALGGCGPVISAPGDDSTSTTNDSAPTPTTTYGDEHATVSDEVTTDVPDPTTPMTTSVDDTTTDPTTSFVPSPDFIGQPECSLFDNDCPRGEKCMPWSNDGGSAWNATRCSPLDPNPRDVGEECMVEGSGVSGIDNCGIGAMCWDVDPVTNMGECVAFCEGSRANPTCADECSQCAINGDGVLALCLPDCDPVAQDCGEGAGCYPAIDRFACIVDASKGAGAPGTACEFVNICEAGTACVSPDLVPNCPGVSGCCAPFCRLGEPDECAVLLPGTACAPWWAQGQAPPAACIDYPSIGVCAAP